MVSRTWCFTVNNWTEEDFLSIKSLPFSYLIIGKEVSKTGTPHLQGYVTLQSPSRLSGLKKINGRAHWEIARSVEASKRYCKKDHNYHEYFAEERVRTGAPSRISRKKKREPVIRDLTSIFSDLNLQLDLV